LKSYIQTGSQRILVAADSPGRREVVIDTLRTFDVQPVSVTDWAEFAGSDHDLTIAVLPLDSGFEVNLDPAITIITESELFGGRIRQQDAGRVRERDPEAIIRDLADLSIGAPVVHEDHGVGRYQGLNILEIDEQEQEFLTLEYAGKDRLYVPVAALQMVSRYTGSSPETAPLHRLGGDQWANVKKRAAKRIRDVAAELLELYAKRQSRSGHAYPVDRQLFAEFAATFDFEETNDQQTAIEAVLADMQTDQPMDRVICGDVGFGKTEVALRAAFTAAQAGRQTAILVPTTLLAQQHYSTFSDRFADWPVRVEVLSRFRTGKQTNSILAGLADGTVDIIIGTHRLIQADIKFKQLGLVIIDEEQRFGVRQKERLKALRSEVDMLTLTATPIPRTLNMALSGLRELSIIATPPARRMAVKTFISPWDKSLIREAIQRELQRGGQVYFLHNEVRTIETAARELQELMPAARIRVAHGQMQGRELESVMRDFYRQRFNVLVCSTIIENGIDVASANTIIINRADKFGLAQLHQLRGRVGRSHHRAYAYLLIPDRRSISSDARKRLEAIESLEELGAGFSLATHDLEIRGAGELLGAEQSGQIHEIGFSVYMDLLERAVAALKAGVEPDLDAPSAMSSDIELQLPTWMHPRQCHRTSNCNCRHSFLKITCPMSSHASRCINELPVPLTRPAYGSYRSR
jgi:transcription-repair coupling factor (superfamily II helicase)